MNNNNLVLQEIMSHKESKKEFDHWSKKLQTYYSENLVPVHEINRSIVRIKWKQPFVEWIKGLPDSDEELLISLTHDSSEPSLYLLPAYESNAQILAHLSGVCHEIFARELESIWTDESDWEKDLSWNNFNRWFDYEICSMPIDLGEDDIIRDEI